MINVFQRTSLRYLKSLINARCILTVQPKEINAQEKIIPLKNNAFDNIEIPGTTIIRSKEMAEKAVKILYQHKHKICAWDTETIGVEVKEESPVGKGHVLCASAFCGPEVDFGNGPRVFIDNYADAKDVFMVFKDYFEDNNMMKCWHNYGFDRHILYNHGIDAKGFIADTMHMARLADPSRVPHDYSLARLSDIYAFEIEQTKQKTFTYLRNKYKDNQEKLSCIQLYERSSNKAMKISIKNTFGYRKTLKSGEEGKTIVFPDLEEIHTSKSKILPWIDYSTFDAEITFFLRETLASILLKTKIKKDSSYSLYDFYCEHWLPFGELLTDMERAGIKVDVEHLKKKQKEAEADRDTHAKIFLNWVHSVAPDAAEFNPSSPAQMQQLLFAPFYKVKTAKASKKKSEPSQEDEERELSDGEEEVKPRKNTLATKEHYPETRTFKVENLSGFIKPGRVSPLKYREMTIRGLGIPPILYTDSGLPKSDMPTIRALAGNVAKKQYGLAYDHFKKLNKEEFGIKICEALTHWIEYKQIDTLIQTFMLPMQSLTDSKSRVHCSLNFNTETGRLSARKPNLQNQPAYEKDKYKIRKAFVAEKGCKFVVADYGQLELRVLAHMTKCKSMIEAFKAGGDFHSRTAIGMFPEIQKAVQEGKVLLEWDSHKGKSPKPLIKDIFGSERKKAKGINFSIAYGKTAHGFAQDWKCTIEEAEKAVEKWYSDRPEVRSWQAKVKQIALKEGWTQTLLGRYRYLTKHFAPGSKTRSHGLRAAINTPIQGGAADLVVAAMIKLHKNQRLRELGWKLLLQIHDEVIMEGPAESAEEAKKLVVQTMIHPFDEELLLPLEVDAKISDNWYEGK